MVAAPELADLGLAPAAGPAAPRTERRWGHRPERPALPPAPCSARPLQLLPEPAIGKPHFPHAGFGPGRCSLLAARPGHVPALSLCHPTNNDAFRGGLLIMPARRFSRSPPLANPASSLGRRLRGSERAGVAQLCAGSRAPGSATARPCEESGGSGAGAGGGLLRAKGRAQRRWQPSEGTVPTTMSRPRQRERQQRGRRWGCSPETVSPRYFNSASWILPLIEQNIIELEMSFNYFLKNRLWKVSEWKYQ